MTYGKPFYSKYNFFPVSDFEQSIYNSNYKLYKKNPTISKKKLLNFINKIKINNKLESYINILKYLENDFIPSLKDKNEVKVVINKLINDSINFKDVCIILSEIYLQIYSYVGYTNYREKLFELFMNNISINKNK
jgi:hypothetical protein